VNPDLVVRDEEGKVGTVRYEAMNAMPLKEFLKTAPESRGSRGSAAETGGGNYAATEADRSAHRHSAKSERASRAECICSANSSERGLRGGRSTVLLRLAESRMMPRMNTEKASATTFMSVAGPGSGKTFVAH